MELHVRGHEHQNTIYSILYITSYVTIYYKLCISLLFIVCCMLYTVYYTLYTLACSMLWGPGDGPRPKASRRRPKPGWPLSGRAAGAGAPGGSGKGYGAHIPGRYLLETCLHIYIFTHL